jgi:phosphatidate phosphatase APP1
VYFSTSSLGLFQFVTDFLCEQETPNWSVTAHLTQHENELEYAEEDERQHNRQMRLGRFRYFFFLLFFYCFLFFFFSFCFFCFFFLLDFYSKMVSEEHCTLQHPVQVYFSTSSLGLFQFVTDFLCEQETPNWSVTAHLTQHENELDYAEEDERQHNRQMRLGRFRYFIFWGVFFSSFFFPF